MREIKFSYIQKSGPGDFKEVIYTLDELETGQIERLILAQKETYGIIARREFTGLKDKNDKDIYDGDIVTSQDGICKVIHVDCAFCLIDSEFRWFSLAGQYMHCKVIGNIYENPELNEGEQK